MDPDAILDRRRLKRRLVFWRVFAALAVMALIAIGIGKFISRGDIHIARLSIDGFIAEDRERGDAIDKLVVEDDLETPDHALQKAFRTFLILSKLHARKN